MANTRLAAESQASNSRLPSPEIFGQLWDTHLHNPTKAFVKFDDFCGYNALASTGTFGAGHWYGFIENSATIANLTTGNHGVIQIATGATADNDTSFSDGQIAGYLHCADGTAPGTITGRGTLMAFEARVRFPMITDAGGSSFIGIIEPGCVANDGNLTDAHAVGAKDLIGFWVLDADNSVINYGYNVTSGTIVEVGDEDVIDATTTWFKLGFVYDPYAPDAQILRFFIDGVDMGTPVTWTTVQASTFPGFQPMAPYFQAKTDDSAAFKLDIDWVCCGQILDT